MSNIIPPITVIYTKFEDKLIPDKKLDITREKIFVDSLKPGEKVEVTFQIVSEKGSEAQMKKLYACIRQLANDLGYSEEEVKLLVKEKSNFIDKENNLIKSFADCTKHELSVAIQAAIEIGNNVGSNLHSF